MSSPSNTKNNPFGPPPAIFDTTVSNTAPPIPLNTTNYLFASTNFNPSNSTSRSLPPNTLTSSIHSLRIPNNSSKSVSNSSPNSSNDWGIPPQSQTELFKPPPPPPPPPLSQHFPHSTSNLSMLQRAPLNRNTFNYRPPPPPPHHQSIVLSNNMSNVPAFNNFTFNATNSKKRKRSPTSSKSDRNVKRRIDETDAFDYDRDRYRNKSRNKRSRNRSRSRSRSNSRHKTRRNTYRSRSRSRSNDHDRTHSIPVRHNKHDIASDSDGNNYNKHNNNGCKQSNDKMDEKKQCEEEYKGNNDDLEQKTNAVQDIDDDDDDDDDVDIEIEQMHKKKGKTSRNMMQCSPPPKPPRPTSVPTPSVMNTSSVSDCVVLKQGLKPKNENVDAQPKSFSKNNIGECMNVQGLGFTAYSFAQSVYALAPLINFGEDLVFPMSSKLSRNDYVTTETERARTDNERKKELICDEGISNICAYIAAAINDDDENSMRIMLEVNMKSSSSNREVLDCELKEELRSIASQISDKKMVKKDINMFVGYEYTQNEKVVCKDGNSVYSTVILDRKLDSNCVALYLVHFMDKLDRLDKWVTGDQLTLMDAYDDDNKVSIFNYKFACDDNVLCWHDNMLYEAKVSSRMLKDGMAHYMVHYHGWNKTWDEWVNQSRILAETAANLELMKSITNRENENENERKTKQNKLIPVNNIHNINMNTMLRMDACAVHVDSACEESDDDDILTVPLQFSLVVKEKEKKKEKGKERDKEKKKEREKEKGNEKGNEKVEIISNNVTSLSSRIVWLERCLIVKEEEWKKKYRKKAKKCREFRECAKRLYSECVHGEGPRWHLIEFVDTEHRVTRDAELAQLRTQINSLYSVSSGARVYDVVGIQKWCGRKEIEESVLKFVTLNGEYSVCASTYIGDHDSRVAVALVDILEKFSIISHRIHALNGQHGIRVKMDIAKNTCFGQYFGGEILHNAFGKVFDGTGEEHDHNIYAFDQKIDKCELRKLKLKLNNDNSKSKENKNKSPRKQIPSDAIHNYDDIPNKVFIIDPFIGDWKNDELLLRYVNDCRVDIDDLTPSDQDSKYYNVEFVGIKVNGWPQTYLIAKRNIKKGEELMTFYGHEFSNAIASKLEEEEKKKIRKRRIDHDILQGVKL